MSTTYVGGVNITALNDKINELIDTLEELKVTNPTLKVPAKSKQNELHKSGA